MALAGVLFFLIGWIKAVEITGAGSTFAFPILSTWSDLWSKQTGHRLNYQPIGSGGGIRQVINLTVDFGASDAPLEPKELREQSLWQLPLVGGAVVLAYNVPQIKESIKLSSSDVCDIFLGKITQWDDPSIAKKNPQVRLPSQKITVIHRSDGSGTTWIFTRWLSQKCPSWKKTVSFGTSVNWPTGLAAKGNEGVTQLIARTPGALGYVEHQFVRIANLSVAAIENDRGQFILPSPESVNLAINRANWNPKEFFYLKEYSSRDAHSYPLWGVTFILLNQKNLERSRKVALFLKWLLSSEEAQQKAQESGYVPLPDSVRKLTLQQLKEYGLID